MIDKEIGEIRRHLRRDRSNMTAIFGCYVNDNKEFILSLASFIDWQKIISDKGNTFYKQCESPEEYNALVEKIINGDAESMDTMILSSTMSNAYNNIVRSHIEIRRVI